MASNRRKKSLDLLDESVAGQSVQNTFAEKVNKPCSVSVIAVEETGAKLDSVRGYEMEGTELKCEKNSGLELAKEEADPISNSRVNDASSQRTKEGLLSCKSNVDIKIEVLNKRTISNYVRKIITSTDLYSQNSDNSIVNEKCGDFECRSTFLELQKINGACRFLDGLLDGRTFISLPADCTLEGTRSLLEQIELAKGVRAIAVRLEDDEDEDEPRGTTLLNSPPRLYLVLTENRNHINQGSDFDFEETLNRLVISCNLPTAEHTHYDTDDSDPVAIEPKAEDVAQKEEKEGEEEEEEEGEGEEEEEEIIFPSLYNIQDSTTTLSSLVPIETSNSTSPSANNDDRSQQGKNENLRIEIPARRSYSVPEVLSIPWAHQSIAAWRNTSMPSWLPCAHHHVHNHTHNYHFFHNVDNEDLSHSPPPPHHHHAEQKCQIEQDFDVPSLSSPTSSVTTIMDTNLVTPILSEAPQSLCIHSRELSSDTVITAATSVQSELEMQEQELRLEECLKVVENTQMSDTEADAAPFGLGIVVDDLDQTRTVTNLPAASLTGSQDVSGLFPTALAEENIVEQQQVTSTLGNGSSTLSISKPIRPKYERNEILLEPKDGMMVEKHSKLPLNLLHAGSSRSVIRGAYRRLPQLDVPYYKLEQPPCNRHYLLEEGCSSLECPYAHDYLLTPSELGRLKNDSKKSPCTALKMGKRCLVGARKCHMGHVCPYGRECRYGHACRFLYIHGAHNGPPINERSAQQARTQLGELTISLIRNSGIPMLPLMSPPITPPSTSDGPSQHLNTTGSQISDFKMFNQGPYSLPNIPGLPIPLQLPPPPPPMRVPMQTSMPMPIEFNIPMTPPAHRQPIASLLSLPPPPPPLGFLPHPLLFGTLPAQAPPLPSLASDPPGQKMFPMMHAPPSLESVEALHPSLSPRQRMSGAATGLKPPAPPCDSRLSAPLLLPVPPSALKNPPTEPPTLVRSNVPKPSRETESFAKLDAPLQDGQHHGCQNVPQDQPKKKKPSRKPFVRRDPVILR